MRLRYCILGLLFVPTLIWAQQAPSAPNCDPLLPKGFVGPESTECPRLEISQILKDPTVRQGLDEAWCQSFEGTPSEREAGSFVLQCRRVVLDANGSTTATYYRTQIVRIITGAKDSLSTTKLPASGPSCRRVAAFHTHPGPAQDPEGYVNDRPSPEDIRASAERRIPEIVRWGEGNATDEFTLGYAQVEGPESDHKFDFPDETIYANEITQAVLKPGKDWCTPPPLPLWEKIPFASCGNPGSEKFVVTNDGDETRKYKFESVGETAVFALVVPEEVELGPGEQAEFELRTACSCTCTPKTHSGAIAFTQGEDEPQEFAVNLSCDAIACGGSVGDPHMRSADGYRFDFQGAGEYVLTTSLASDFEVQVRIEPWTAASSVSINTAVAARINGDRVGVYRDSLDRIHVNGQARPLPTEGSMKLPGGGTVSSPSKGHIVVLSSGSDVLEVIGNPSALQVYFGSQSKTEGLVRLANESRALRTRGGQVLQSPVAFGDLYREFGDSWLVSAGDSLFDYPDGKTTDSYRIAGFPKQHISLPDLGGDARQRAEQACAASGVSAGEPLRDCVYDVAVTGDEAFAILAARDNSARAEGYVEIGVLGPGVDAAADTTATLIAPRDVAFGLPLRVIWSGPAGEGDFISIAQVDKGASAYDNFEYVGLSSSVALKAPESAGGFEVRYVTGQTREILARTLINVVPPRVSVDAPKTVELGSRFIVAWEGPALEQDYIAVAPADAGPSGYDNYAYVGEAETVAVLAPEVAGIYEVRYVTGRTREILASDVLEVVAVPTSVRAPKKVTLGAPFDVTWSGPALSSDYIAVAPADAGPSGYDNYAYVGEAETVAVLAPEVAGIYEVRYVTGRTREILASDVLEVVAVPTSVRAPKKVTLGAPFDVTWSGPALSSDYIAVATKDQGASSYTDYAYVGSDETVTLKAPETEGEFEVRYVTGRTRQILARQRLTVVDDQGSP